MQNKVRPLPVLDVCGPANQLTCPLYRERIGHSHMPSYGIHLRDDYANGGHEIKSAPRQPWQAWFKSPTWKAIKRHRLMQEPNCRCCAQEGCAVIATDVGHVDPHEGQWSRFIQYENTQSLCARHHRQLKKRAACSCDNQSELGSRTRSR